MFISLSEMESLSVSSADSFNNLMVGIGFNSELTSTFGLAFGTISFISSALGSWGTGWSGDAVDSISIGLNSWVKF